VRKTFFRTPSRPIKSHHIPGGATARNVDTADERIVVEVLRFALLGFQDARTVDELELVGRRAAGRARG
jgi:hypothetical protein